MSAYLLTTLLSLYTMTIGLIGPGPSVKLPRSAFEICDNGIDDDGDGLIDCQDSDCVPIPYCRTEDDFVKCRDGIDNDGDGDIDCADSECNCSSTETVCNNGVDDDGDGLIDCEDSDCKDFVSCFESDCNNGIDDDGDGFADHYDGDCQKDPANPIEYIMAEPSCSGRPTGNVFDFQEAWRSESRTATSRVLPVVADIDNDGTPEVISYNENNTLSILSGIDGSVERSVTYSNDIASSNFNTPYLAVGDVDGDGYGEIFHYEQTGWIRAFSHDLSLIWKQQSFEHYRVPALADFNQDGRPELYFGNEIRNALTGEVIIRGSHDSTMYSAGNNWQTELNAVPVAVDILPSSACVDCGGLELVLGHVIYTVDIVSGTLNEELVMNSAATKDYSGGYYPKDPAHYGGFYGQNYSSTAVVDFNGDGYLDVLTSGATGDEGGPNTVFFWDIQNDEVKTFVASTPADQIHASIIGNYRDLSDGSCGGTEDCTWIRGMGSLNVVNIDGDPELECVFSSGSSLYAINPDMQLEWANHEDFWESTSGVTGVTAFDFSNDGASELIYRDQVDLYIVDGMTGRIINDQYSNLIKCSSQTLAEYPVVADVDGDGEAELIVSCSDYENEKYAAPNSSGSNNKDGHIRVYESAADTYWSPARSVWNQFAYYNVNVNDDLSIPRYQAPHHQNFASSCADPYAPARFPLNQFLNQAPYLDYCGNPVIPVARLEFVDQGVVSTPPVCGDDSLLVTLTFRNSGDRPVNEPIPFAFYTQDPTLEYTNADPNPWLDSLYLSVPGGLLVGQRHDTTVMIRGARGQHTLYVSMNDIGPFDRATQTPIDNWDFYPLVKLNGTVPECGNFPTIITHEVDPIPFELIVSATDNHRCSDGTGINNGEIKVTDTDGQPLAPLTNYELTLTNLEDDAVVDISGSLINTEEGTFIVGLDAGTYTVSAQYHSEDFSCGSALSTVAINRIDGWPSTDVVTVEKLKDVSSCVPGTADGEALVLINGEPADDRTYEVRWQNEQDPADIIFGASVTHLKPVMYNIFLTNLITGCVMNDSSLAMDLSLPTMDDPVVVPPSGCSSANGSIMARMLDPSDRSRVEYWLLQESPVRDTIRSTTGMFSDLSEGVYELKAVDLANGCGWETEGVLVELISSPTDIVASVEAHDSSCNPAQSTGSIRVSLSDGTPLDESSYTFLWKNLITGDTVSYQQEARGLVAGMYTVAVSQAPPCPILRDTVIVEEVALPLDISQMTIETTPQTLTEAPNGSASLQWPDGLRVKDHTFRWTDENGKVISTSPFAVGLTYGSYQLTVTHNTSGCYDTRTIEVENQIAEQPTFEVSFDIVPDKTYGDAPFSLPINNPNRHAITLKVLAGDVRLQGSTVYIEGAGEVIIEAAPVNSTDSLTETARVTFTVHKQAQTIDHFIIQPVSDSTFLLSGQATSGLPVAYRVTAGEAKIADSILVIYASGTVAVEAFQEGDHRYGSASPVRQSVSTNFVTGLLDEYSHSTIRIYPNPSHSGFFRISHDQPSHYWVTSGNGRLISQGKTRGNAVLNLSHVPVGTYILKLTGRHGTTYHKLIRQ